MGSDEMIEFEADNYEDLLETFKDKHRSLWEDFIYDAYREHCGDMIDHAKTMRKENFNG